ncbi:hypothetical protein N7452_001333 [Penicillium brevicompactum]|uniref:Oxidoreductase molybdopterin-binding domain-containing protein n=1 Tax=Penicillium brevicompactum TaxID=5074 RepID=A0A9W9UPZ5_PENBR|nr:hypothetical protein N7452_001333 [Penicillium brevicompactum]
MAYKNHPVDFLDQTYIPDSERGALVAVQPQGFFIRHPPKPHELEEDVTDEAHLFQTIHMGAAVVDTSQWRLIIDGLVERPFGVNFDQLRQMPPVSVTSFHECYGSPLVAPTKNVWRIGNVEWTGVPLRDLLAIARPHPQASYIWSDGLDSGGFAGVAADRYRKDLPMEKALSPEVLVAYEMNGQPLSKERGGPVRLVVPGWFGTNSTKWLCRLSLQATRSQGPFTTVFYNELDPEDVNGVRTRPVWKAQPNAMIVRPHPQEVFDCGHVEVWGRTWGAEEIVRVDIFLNGDDCGQAVLAPRTKFEWQLFSMRLHLPQRGKQTIQARATDRLGAQQALEQSRNHVPTVQINVT